jgi:hypothetical protein
VDRPPIYETLRDRPEEGALLELPVGIRTATSRGSSTTALAYQIIHRRPIVGGVVPHVAVDRCRLCRHPLIDGLLTCRADRIRRSR